MRVHPPLMVSIIVYAIALGACSAQGNMTLEPTTPTETLPPTAESPVSTAVEPLETPEPTMVPTRQTIESGNIAQLQLFRTLTMDAAIRAVEFSPDGSQLASASGDTDSYEVVLWDVESGQLVRKLTGHTAIVWDVTFSPDGQYLASSSKDQTVRVWQVDDGSEVHVFHAPGEVTSVAFTPDSRYLAYGGVDSWPVAAVWLVEAGSWNQVLKVEEGWNIPAILFTPDSLLMIAGGISRNVRAWYIPQGDQVYIIYFPGQAYDLALSPDARTLAAAPCTASSANICQNVELWLRDAGSGAVQARIFAGTSPIQALRYSPDGGLLLTGSQDGVLKAWSVPGAEILVALPLHQGTIEDLAFSSGGDLLATGGSDGTVRVWRAP